MSDNSMAPDALIDGFKLEKRIHTGGMASIWRVKRDDLDLPMAMKIPRLTEGDDPSFIATFEAEQMILPKLTGPHVPRFVANGDLTEQPFIVMEYISGPSLRDRLASVMFFPEEIARIGALIATALHNIHCQHVIHLDVSPDNILFRKTGEAVFIDFGLSRHDHLPDLMAEKFDLPMGTGPYISPEQVLNIRSDPRSDIFSLGVILYQLTTGELPFGDPKSKAGLKRRLYVDPARPGEINKECPNWLQEIILKCLEVNPEARYNSAAHLALALQNPEQVVLTARPKKTDQNRLFATLKRWLLSTILLPEPAIKTSVSRHLATVPIILVAVDTGHQNESLADAIRQAVKRIFSVENNSRVTCVTIRKTPLVGIDFGLDEQGRNLHVQYLVKLKHWARPLDLPPDRISFHVLEAPDPATALVHYAKANSVAHIIIGARDSSTIRRFLGSVSSHVVASAHCTVTVVRTFEAEGP